MQTIQRVVIPGKNKCISLLLHWDFRKEIYAHLPRHLRALLTSPEDTDNDSRYLYIYNLIHFQIHPNNNNLEKKISVSNIIYQGPWLGPSEPRQVD